MRFEFNSQCHAQTWVASSANELNKWAESDLFPWQRDVIVSCACSSWRVLGTSHIPLSQRKQHALHVFVRIFVCLCAISSFLPCFPISFNAIMFCLRFLSSIQISMARTTFSFYAIFIIMYRCIFTNALTVNRLRVAWI